MINWNPLDMRRASTRPAPGQLVVLHMAPTNERATFYNREKYDIGRFEPDKYDAKKILWHGARGLSDPVNMRKHYTIWWLEIDEFR